MRRSVLAVPAVLAALVLTGCTGQNAQPQGAQSPDPVSSEALLAALAGVDPGLEDDASVDIADEICAMIDEGEDTEAIDEYAVEEFGPLAENEFDAAQAQDAITVITSDWCTEGNSEQNN